jgi:hypothetical protein
MTLVPSTPPDDETKTSDADVQRVVAVRTDGGGAGNDPLAALGARTAAVFGDGARRFFTTVKRMTLLGVVLALGAAWWAENGSVIRGAAAALLVFVPAVVIAVVVAGRLAAASLAVETWRQAGLTRQVLGLLLDRMGGPDADATGGVGRLPLSDAVQRLKLSAAAWVAESAASSSLIARSQRWLAGLVERVTLRAFRAQADSGGVDVARVRESLADQVDDLVAARVRAEMRSMTAGAVLGLVAYAVLVAYLLRP